MNQTASRDTTHLTHIRETASDFIAQKYPGALCAFIAGSVVRGDHTATSDIDLVVMFPSDYETPHRNSYSFNSWPIEVFVQNEKAQEYFLEQDRQRGMCVLATMIAEGLVIGPDPVYAEMRQERARQFIAAGPLLMGPDEIQRRIYSICDHLDDIRTSRPDGETLGCLANLYLQLGDLHLRAKGQWSGHGKQLYRRLKLNDDKLAQRYERAFAKAHQDDNRPLFALAEEILEPLGGFNWEGYYAAASDKWRD